MAVCCRPPTTSTSRPSWTALEQGADVATVHEQTGLTALHIAAGTNNLPLAAILIEDWNAPFGPDRFGRWPTVIAAECKAQRRALRLHRGAGSAVS